MKTVIDEFADIKVMRFEVPGWEGLNLRQKEYVFHLSEAAKAGRDITWNQYCKWNLPVRHAVENILENYHGDRDCPEFQDFVIYAKRLFFSGGFHHHYAETKFLPDCSIDYFRILMTSSGCLDEQLLEAGVAPDLIRLSVGIEDAEDILDDIKQALAKI